MSRQALERHQVWLYLGAVGLGLMAGHFARGFVGAADALLWPVLALLLLATFTQVPLTHMAAALRDIRFLGTMLAGNFLLLPVLVAVLLPLLPADPAIVLGVLLVLLLPCTDWSITFTHLARGDTARMIAAVPVLLLVQMALLPVYLWLFLGRAELGALPAGRLVAVFLGFILLPLLMAWWLERLAERQAGMAVVVRAVGALPVPLLAVVVFLIAMGQGEALTASLPLLPAVVAVFVLFLVGALGLAIGMARALRLPAASGRALGFSLTTRNSFVVLPLALALPAGWEVAAQVIVLQSLVELLGMLVLLRLAARLFPAR